MMKLQEHRSSSKQSIHDNQQRRKKKEKKKKVQAKIAQSSAPSAFRRPEMPTTSQKL
jgi:hypothetical protein